MVSVKSKISQIVFNTSFSMYDSYNFNQLVAKIRMDEYLRENIQHIRFEITRNLNNYES